VLADGTKEFDLTASIIDWEVAPGKVVKAWAYNNQVPGPWIKVNVGDKVRVVLDNQLPQSTVIHFHGIETPNPMDGVPDVTQPPVKPGEQFTYEFVAKGPAMGMYHSHHHAEHQVPDGLLGVFQIGDPPLPPNTGPVTQQVPMVLNDAGVIGLTLNGKSFPATAPVMAKVGDWVQITYANEGLQIHPMHLHAPTRCRSRPASGSRSSCIRRPTSSAPTAGPACGRSTATSSAMRKASKGCSAW
jgi:FtsP/CotA-like multicopper oxidase with cupredoxin domain